MSSRCPRKPLTTVILVNLAAVIFCSWYILPVFLEPPLYDIPTPPEYKKALLQHASPDGMLFISAGDQAFGDMALNLYKTSYARFTLDNHLFAAYDDKLCGILIKEGANCVQYVQLTNTDRPSMFNSNDFKKKVYTKTKIVLDALILNITVIFVDLDIVFLKNPLTYLTCPGCDLIIQADGGIDDLNTGFYLIKPTPASKLLMKTSWKRMRQSSPTWASGQQKQFNNVLRSMTSQGQIKHVILDRILFPNGRDFFNFNRRSFKGDSPCSDCVIVHNNWMSCKARKRYRFKEYGLWQVDDNQYYSNPKRKYIVYDNPLGFDGDWTRFTEAEDGALRTAFILGHILNRTVIVPKFHGDGQWENFGYWYDLSILDSQFLDAYREHVFLENELVPQGVKSSVSDTYTIHPKGEVNTIQNEPSNVRFMWTSGVHATVGEIKKWFSGPLAQVSVLKFHSLYNSIMTTDEIQPFVERLNQYFRRKATGHFCLNGFCLRKHSLVDC